ncbi:MAG: succinyl-diaminopimelate desuccinylase [Alphaproteobacteria bacterium]
MPVQEPRQTDRPPSPHPGLDPVELTRRLIRCPSVTPEEGGALTLLAEVLDDLGFTCERLRFSEAGHADVDNLYARIGGGGRQFCFAGHTDVVPVGDAAAWSVDPFAAELVDGRVIGRGAVDMKGAIACFVAAAADVLAQHGNDLDGSISLLITGDEEADAVNGTRKVLDWLKARDGIPDVCMVGEPTSDKALGDMVKIGRRGSMTGALTVTGTQGHTAYPHLADNPLHHLVTMLDAIVSETLDDGTEHFSPTSLQLTSVDVGNTVGNVIPAQATAAFNIRFNDKHNGASLEDWLRKRLDAAIDTSRGGAYELRVSVSGESFLCPPGPLSDLICQAVESVTGRRPVLGTTGGTSDARFIKDYCPVAELGLLNATAHKVDEQVAVTDLRDLHTIYRAVLEGYFSL